MDLEVTIEDLKKLIPEGVFQGELGCAIKGIGSLDESKEGDLSFLSNKKYTAKVASSLASVILVPNQYEGEPSKGQVYIRVDNPSFALANICRMLEQKLWPRQEPGIHATAYVDDSAEVAASAYIGPFCHVAKGAKVGENAVLVSHCFVGQQAEIGEESYLMPHITVMDYCAIGKRVRINPQVSIGGEGYGFTTLKDGTHKREPQIGRVVIEDDVDVGSGTTIDRARFSETRIGQGTKVDNLVMIAHNVNIGKHCLIVSQVGISGSTTVEDNVVIGGQTGIVGHVRIGKGSMIGAKSGINNDLEPGSYVRGVPAWPYMLAQRLDVLKKRLPEIFKRVSTLEEEIESLKSDHGA